MINVPPPRQPSVQSAGAGPDSRPDSTGGEVLALLRWHIDRYDRLRASTASRAAVVLSASALLSAANAVIIAQVLGTRFTPVPSALLAFCVLPSLAGFVLVVLAVVHATGVLVTTRNSRALLTGPAAPPPGPVFNRSDTLGLFATYAEFSTAVDMQDEAAIIEAAKAELWIVIHQHSYRYAELRSAVRLLRLAATALPVALVVVLIVGLSAGG